MRNAELDEAQAGINIARRNINNLRYADDTTLMAESARAAAQPLVGLSGPSPSAPQPPDLTSRGPLTWRREWQPLQYSCPENPMDRGAWRAIVLRVSQWDP